MDVAGPTSPCGRYFLAPLTGNKEGSMGLMALRVRSTLTLYSPKDCILYQVGGARGVMLSKPGTTVLLPRLKGRIVYVLKHHVDRSMCSWYYTPFLKYVDDVAIGHAVR